MNWPCTPTNYRIERLPSRNSSWIPSLILVRSFARDVHCVTGPAAGRMPYRGSKRESAANSAYGEVNDADTWRKVCTALKRRLSCPGISQKLRWERAVRIMVMENIAPHVPNIPNPVSSFESFPHLSAPGLRALIRTNPHRIAADRVVCLRRKLHRICTWQV